MDNAAVIGYGVVGKATAEVFGIWKHFDLKDANITLEDAAKCQFIFLCLPTPVKNGQYDLSAITGIISQISQYGCGGIIINRSTVTPGTARHLAETYQVPLVANPEFLTEKTAEYDAKHPDFIVIGADSPIYAKAVRGLYEARFKQHTDIIETDTITAETIKVGLNAFYATKVVFANQIYDLCQKIEANYETVKEAWYKSKFVAKNHFTVQHNGGRGAKGKCLGKDLEAFAEFSQSELLKTVQNINKQYPDK